MPSDQIVEPARGSPGHNIVRAWFDMVFRPLLRGLKLERDYLTHRNWTWQFRPESPRFLRPVAEHIDAADNLDQILTFYPRLHDLINDHDRRVSSLFKACQSFQYALAKNEVLNSLYEKIAEESESRFESPVSAHFGAYIEKEARVGVLAESIVNDHGELPSYYKDSRIWNHYLLEFKKIRDLPEFLEHTERIQDAGEVLGSATEALRSAIERIRSDLSLQHDVPYVTPASLVG